MTSEAAMKCVKQDRYVSRRGPFDQWSTGCVERALADAENEGWPIAVPVRDIGVRSSLPALLRSDVDDVGNARPRNGPHTMACPTVV